MLGVQGLAQGKKGTGEDKESIGIRCPPDIYRWLDAGRLSRETDTGMVLRALEQLKELEDGAGDRIQELRATAMLERTSFGKMVASLALEALDLKRRKNR